MVPKGRWLAGWIVVGIVAGAAACDDSPLRPEDPAAPRRAPATAVASRDASPPTVRDAGVASNPRDAAAPAPATSAGRRVCYPALPGDEVQGGNEDPTSFDLAFSTVEIAGLAPIEIAGQARLPDFADGDIRVAAPPGATKLRLRSPVKAWFHGPAIEHCEVVPSPPARTPSPPRAAAPAPETRAWARALKVGGALLHAGRVPAPVAAELAPLLAAARAGTKLRWIRALAPGDGEAGPPLLVASHRDRQPAPSWAGDAGTASSLELTVALLRDDGSAYGLVDVATARMHDEEPWQVAPSLRVDGDPHPDTVLVAPILDAEGLHDGVLIALTAELTVSHVALFPRDPSGASDSSFREGTCFGRVEDRPALLVVRERAVDAFVADATGHFARAPALWGQILASGEEPSSFTPVHSNDGSRMEEGPLDPAQLHICPADGQGLDLYARIAHPGFPGGAPKLVRAHRLALTKAAVGRRAGLLELSRLPAR